MVALSSTAIIENAIAARGDSRCGTRPAVLAFGERSDGPFRRRFPSLSGARTKPRGERYVIPHVARSSSLVISREAGDFSILLESEATRASSLLSPLPPSRYGPRYKLRAMPERVHPSYVGVVFATSAAGALIITRPTCSRSARLFTLSVDVDTTVKRRAFCRHADI